MNARLECRCELARFDGAGFGSQDGIRVERSVDGNRLICIVQVDLQNVNDRRTERFERGSDYLPDVADGNVY